MAFTFCTSGAAIIKAGANRNVDIDANATALDDFSNQVEGQIIADTRRDWLTNWSSLTSGAQAAITDCASDLIAVKIIAYDPDSIGKSTASFMTDVLLDNAKRNINNLKEFKSNEIKVP